MDFVKIKNSDFTKAVVFGAGATLGARIATKVFEGLATLFVKGNAAIASKEVKGRKAA